MFVAGDRTDSVAAAAGVSARSASAARTVPSIRSHAAVISPPMYTRAGSSRVDDGCEAEAEIARRRLHGGDRLGVAGSGARDQVVDAERALVEPRGPAASISRPK